MSASNFNEHELLDLIEGNLGPERARELRARLAEMGAVSGGGRGEGERAVRAVELMARDRAGLMGMAEPELPTDFVADLEPMLARPMLYGSDERGYGSYRRQQSRHARASRRVRFAAVAAGLLVLLGGSWMVTRGLLERRDSQERAELLAGGGGQGDEAASGGLMEAPGSGMLGGADGNGATAGELPAGAVVHHHVDLAKVVGGDRLASAGAAAAAGVGAAASGEGERVAVEIALMIAARSVNEAERVIASCIDAAGRDGRCALVRNFSFEDAAELEEQWRQAQARRAGGSQAAVLIGERPGEFARRVEDQMRGGSGRPVGELMSASGVVAGEALMEPSFERQLVLSSRGAAFTLAVRAGDLDAWMHRLRTASTEGGLEMWLAALEPAPAAEAVARLRDSGGAGEERGTVAAKWGAGGVAAAAELAAIAARQPDAIVELPVVLRGR